MNDEEVSECLELIDKLKKEKKGNPSDLDAWKQMLIEDKNLNESNLNYLKRLDGQIISKSKKGKKFDEPIVTTTEAIQGKTIVEYFGIVSGHAVMGMNFVTDMIGGIRDVIGGRSGTLESYFLEARELALDEMIDKIRNYSEMKGSLLVKLSRDAQVPGTEIFTSLSGIYTHLFAMRKDEIQTLDLSDAAFYDSREHY